MLHNARTLSGYEVHGSDGKIGRAVDAYFDDTTHEIRCLVVETGRWLPDKKLLIPAGALGVPNITARIFPINMTREEASRCQSTAPELPVSWRLEELLESTYGPLDDDRGGGPPRSVVRGSAFRQAVELAEAAAPAPAPSRKLRSLREVLGYRIEATDGPLGFAKDFLLDDEGWAIRYAVVDTESWKPGREVLAPPEWVETVSWAEKRIHLKVSRAKLKTSQRADPGTHQNL